MIRRAPRADKFTIVPNATLEDERLSFKAVGLLCYLLSKPDHWRVDRDQLARTHPDGVRAVRSALVELADAGYLRTEPRRGDDGRLDGTEAVVYERPVTDNGDRVARNAPVGHRVARNAPGAKRAPRGSTENEAKTDAPLGQPTADAVAASLPGLDDPQPVNEPVDDATARESLAWKLIRASYDARSHKPIESRKTAAATVVKLLEAGWGAVQIGYALRSAPSWSPNSIQIELARGDRKPAGDRRYRPPQDDPRREGESRVVDVAAEMRRARGER